MAGSWLDEGGGAEWLQTPLNWPTPMRLRKSGSPEQQRRRTGELETPDSDIKSAVVCLSSVRAVHAFMY